jgi:hypothetical protein
MDGVLLNDSIINTFVIFQICWSCLLLISSTFHMMIKCRQRYAIFCFCFPWSTRNVKKLLGLLWPVVQKYQHVQFAWVSSICLCCDPLFALILVTFFLSSICLRWLWLCELILMAICFFYFFVWMPERLDPDTSGILTTLCDHSFQCPCVSKWTYLSCQVCRFSLPWFPVSTFYYT